MKIWAVMVGVGLCMGGVARAEGPAWCKVTDGQRLDVYGLEHALSGDSVLESVHDLVGAICKPSADAKAKHAELEAQRKAWSDKLAMSESDWADAAAWAIEDASSRGMGSIRPDPKKKWSTLGAVDQYALLGFHIGPDYDAHYMADAFADKLTESGRAAYLEQCLGSDKHEVEWAMCQGDADAFDFKKLAAEISADKTHTGFERFVVRLAGYRLAEKLAAHAAQVKAAKDRDPAYGKMFDIASATRKEWLGLWRSDAALLDLALSMDDARVSSSRRALEGCDDKTWAAWKTAVGGIPAKKFSAVVRDRDGIHYTSDLVAVVGSDPEGYLAGTALYVCGGAGKRDPLLRYLGEAFNHWPGYRGPRTGAQSAIMTAGLELDDRTAKLVFPSVFRQWFERNWGSSGGGSGVLAAVKPSGATTRLEFSPKMEKSTRCVSSKRTNHITAIRSDGTLVYEVNCTKEEPVMVNKASAPQTVNSRYATGVHAGQSVEVVEDAIIAVFAAGKPVMIGGAPVK